MYVLDQILDNKVYPLQAPVLFFYIKVRVKGVYISQDILDTETGRTLYNYEYDKLYI